MDFKAMLETFKAHTNIDDELIVMHEGGEMKSARIEHVGEDAVTFSFRTSPVSKLRRIRAVPFSRIHFVEKPQG